MRASHIAGLLLGLFGMAAPVAAQNITLSETPRVGECFALKLDMTLKGEIRVTGSDGKPQALPLTAEGHHQYKERFLDVSTRAGSTKVARWYDTADSSSVVQSERISRKLRDTHRLVVAQRHEDSFLAYSPVGPLRHEEMELVSEQFDTMLVTGLLPGKSVSVGDTWKLDPITAQAMCLFDGLISQELTGKAVEVKDGKAVFTITGKASGIEHGALVNLSVDARGEFDLLQNRLVGLTWKQKDERSAGPISPAVVAEITVQVRREKIDQPKELADTALVSIPDSYTPPATLTSLVHVDSEEKFVLGHSRDWHLVGKNGRQTIFRLMERGDFLAQATLTLWERAEPGKHLSVEEFKRLITQTPGLEIEEVIDEREIPTEAGRWVYRLMLRGEMDDVKVVQTFFVVAGPNGDQMIFAFTMKPANTSKIGTRDVALVNSIEFPPKK